MSNKGSPNKPKSSFFFPEFRHALHVLWTSAKPRRLFKEDKGVEGNGWYAKNCDDFWHVPINTLRVFILVTFAPLYAIWRLLPVSKVVAFNATHIEEPVCTPEAILYKSPSSGEPGGFDPMGYYPKWLLKVTFRGADEPVIKQVPVTGVMETGYTAISYPMDSAQELFRLARMQLEDPKPSDGRQISLRDRQRISRCVLNEYARARAQEGKTERVEYIWLDEFCLASESLSDSQEIERERLAELGRLGDIFRNAETVIVFCHRERCNHTTLDCPWGNRLFTIAEILHAQRIVTMTLCANENSAERLVEWEGRVFKGQMQLEAAKAGRYHLSTILTHATNAGSGSWQSAIHALVVEAIRRDEAGNFEDHKYLGKALNGLLPRRARIEDLPGKNGWADLAWLLELNQGYYNAAGLAAVCNINLTVVGGGKGSQAGGPDARTQEYRWWGKPISPLAGNERLEPIVTAFPVVVDQSTLTLGEDNDPGKDEETEEPEPNHVPVLSILAPRIIRINHNLRRDGEGLYRHEDMVKLRDLMYFLATIMVHIGIPFVSVGRTGETPSQTRFITSGAILLYLAFVVVVIVELVASTVYIKREGWVFLPDKEWGADPSYSLGELDPRFKKLKTWGARQLVPRWDSPTVANGENTGPRLISGSLVDLKTKVCTKVVVFDDAYPDLMVVLAVHGTGVTGILLQAPEGYDDEEEPDTSDENGILDDDLGPDKGRQSMESDEDEEVPIHVFTKVGMANLPAYVLSKSEHWGTIFVGGSLPSVKEVPEKTTVRAKKIFRGLFRKSQKSSSVETRISSEGNGVRRRRKNTDVEKGMSGSSDHLMMQPWAQDPRGLKYGRLDSSAPSLA